MNRRSRLLALGLPTAVSVAVTLAGLPVGVASAATVAVQPSAASALTLPAPTTTSTAADRHLPADRFAIGVRDRLLTTGKLAWIPTTTVPFDSAYQYVSGTGPGTKGDYHVATMVAFAQKSRLAGVLPVLSYFRINGNYKGAMSAPAACTATCTRGDTAKRNLDHLNDPTFMQPYFTHLVESFRALDARYSGQFLMHVEPDLSGYAQQLSIDRVRCAADCVPGVPADHPAGVRAAVASSGISQLSGFPNTLQGFFSAVLYLRDQYAPRVSLAYHVSNWATARTGTVSGANDATNSISVGNKPVDAAALGARVARFAELNGATASNQVARPGPATSNYDVLFNDILDNDAGYFATATNHPEYWWDSENIDVPNFARWETYLGAITSRVGLPTTVWQVPLGNTVFKVESNTPGHYQDNRLEYFFDHLQELTGIGVTGIIFGSSEKSTWGGDNRLDVTDNSTVVCTTLGSHSATRRCPSRDALVADDDGGYLRERATAYYASPIALT